MQGQGGRAGPSIGDVGLIESGQDRFWGLGPNKWKECVDGMDRVFGQEVYDLCLHGKNGGKTEPGYMKSMENAQEYIGSQLGKRTTVEAWKKTHSLACNHFQGSSTGTLMNGDEGGKLRGPNDSIFQPHCMNGALALSDEAIAEIEGMNPRIIYIKWPSSAQREESKVESTKPEKSGGGFGGDQSVTGGTRAGNEKKKYRQDVTVEMHFVALSADDIEQVFRDYLTAFYEEMDRLEQTRLNYKPRPSSTRSGARFRSKEKEAEEMTTIRDLQLRNIAKLHQNMERLHPARDGNTRTNILFLNKHLVECDFNPVLLYHTQKSSCCGLDEFVSLVSEGMTAWREEMEGVKAG